MTEVTVTNPVMVVQKEIDSSGRVYLGNDLAGEEMEIIAVQKKTDDAEDVDSEPQEAA